MIKKIGIVIGLFFIISGACFAENTEGLESTESIDALIRAGLNKNYDSIREEAASLNETERLEIYKRNKKNYFTGGLVNLIPNIFFWHNFGIGNFIQGDKIGGFVTLAGNLAGIGVLIYGFADQARIERNLTADDDMVPTSAFFLIGPMISYVFSSFGTVRSIVYPISYNNKLKKALQIVQVSVNIEPSLYITGKKYELNLVRVRY